MSDDDDWIPPSAVAQTSDAIVSDSCETNEPDERQRAGYSHLLESAAVESKHGDEEDEEDQEEEFYSSDDSDEEQYDMAYNEVSDTCLCSAAACVVCASLTICVRGAAFGDDSH